MVKRGRPKGVSFKTQERIINLLMRYERGISLKNLVQRSRLARNTVINALKKLEKKGVISKTKVGRQSIHKLEDWRYYHDLRLRKAYEESRPSPHTALETLLNDEHIKALMKEYNIRGKELLKRILKDRYVDMIMKGSYWYLIFRRAFHEILEERREEKRIDVK